MATPCIDYNTDILYCPHMNVVFGELADMPHAARTVELFENGIAETPYAWHGTSIEAIIYLAGHGRLPAEGTLGDSFYYAPEAANPGEQERHARVFAEHEAKYRFLLSRLPYDPADKQTLKFSEPVDVDFDDIVVPEGVTHGITPRTMELLYYEAREYKGVLIGVTEAVTQYGEITTAIEDERYAIIPEGLPIDHITGIEPLSDHEWDILTILQESLQKTTTPQTELLPQHQGDPNDMVDIAVLRHYLNLQTQYTAQFIEGSAGHPKLSEDIVIGGNSRNYHSLKIRRGDIVQFVSRILEYRAAQAG